MAKSCFLGLKRVQKVKKVVLGLEKKFQPNRSKNSRNMAKSCFLGLKMVQKVKKVVLGLEKNFQPNRSKYGQNLFSRPKKYLKVQNVVLGPKKIGQIGEKIVRIPGVGYG